MTYEVVTVAGGWIVTIHKIDRHTFQRVSELIGRPITPATFPLGVPVVVSSKEQS